MRHILGSKWTKRALFVVSLIPIANLGRRAYEGRLTANPIEFITHYTGDWTIYFLLITLSITPLREMLKQPQLIRFRKMFGLWAFFYGSVHFLIWAALDKLFDPADMWADVMKRRFITAGMLGLFLMLPLALTSTAGWVRRLGWSRWQKLHRLIYFTVAAGVVHYYWLVKSDHRFPVLYGTIFLTLMLCRAWIWGPGKKRKASR